MHFAFNMIGLYSFAPETFDNLKFRRMGGFPNVDDNKVTMNINSTYHNIAFFMSCGIIANLIPHYISLLSTRSAALMSSSAAGALVPRPGLGASGAVYSCLTFSALAYPDKSIVLIFLPMLPFSIGYGVCGLCLVDAIGVIRGWHQFGHLTHLTGAAAGVGAYFYGPAAWYWGQYALRGGRIRTD
jgi:rhomboid-like protein